MFIDSFLSIRKNLDGRGLLRLQLVELTVYAGLVLVLLFWIACYPFCRKNGTFAYHIVKNMCAEIACICLIPLLYCLCTGDEQEGSGAEGVSLDAKLPE